MNIMSYILCFVLIVLGALSRVIDHAPNFTPVIAIAIMSGLFIKNKYIMMIPLSIMLLSDLFIDSYPLGLAFWVYLPIIFVCYSAYLSKSNGSNIVKFSFFGPIVFFIVSNFGVWFMGGYPKNLEGLVTCYTMAIPFFKNTLSSTIIFNAMVVAIYLSAKALFKQSKIKKIF